MPDRIRIYHPETYEPFDLPVDKATDLRLNKGWLSSRPDPDAIAAVQTIAPADGTGTFSSDTDEGESWRDHEVVEQTTSRRRTRKPE